MKIPRRSRFGKTALGVLALAVVAGLVPAPPASAATFSNVCVNTASTDAAVYPLDMTANSPTTVAPGDPVTLSNIDQTLTVPATIFVTGYNLGLVLPGQPPAVTPTEAILDATAQTTIEATNTVEGVQTTNLAVGTVTTTISDPDGTRATGDETATPGALSVTYADLDWTAGNSPGTIDFREDTVQPISTSSGGEGALIAKAIIFPGVLEVTYACSPGTVSPDPGPAANIDYDDPAVSFASTEIQQLNQPPVADAGADQTVDSEQAGVTLDGSGSTDPDGDGLTYSWTQTSGPTVTLSGADTATPTFDAPVGPATLEFQLEVSDDEPLSDTDSVVVNVNAPPNNPPVADAGADQTVDSEQAGVTLDGSGSTDPDGDGLTYSWTQTSGPTVTLSGADTATPTFDAPVGPATLEFQLEISDDEFTDTDSVAVNVNAPVTQPPTTAAPTTAAPTAAAPITAAPPAAAPVTARPRFTG